MRSRLARYLLTLILPSGLLCLIFLASLYHEEQTRIRQALEAAELLRLETGVHSLTRDLGLVASDVRLLASLPSLAAVLQNADAETMARLTADISAISASRRFYDQLRWIDETGMERVRVDYVQNQPRVVPAERLQNKAQRYYYTGTMRLAADEVFVSPLDLNVEQDRVETPYKPMLRLAVRVWDSEGRARGIVIANFFASYLLDAFAVATESRDESVRISLLNRDGFWLKAPQASDEWGFMLGRKDHFGTRYPAAWKVISAGERGQFENDDGFWSFETVRPLLAGMTSGSGASAELPDSTVPVGADEYVWKVVSRVPAEALRQARTTSLGGWVVITLLFMGTLFAGCLVLARAHRRRDLMADNLRTMNRRLEEKVRLRTEELHQQAIRDSLTGLFNRRYLDETLPREISRALRENESLAVVMIDLDYFKRFNDEWGHEAGDAVLLGVAETLLDGLRMSDIACRWGGEEILVVMPGADTAEAVRRISAIAAQVRNMGARVMGRELSPVTFSAGVAMVPDHGNNAEALVRAADRALYMAKETGRDRVVVARPAGADD